MGQQRTEMILQSALMITFIANVFREPVVARQPDYPNAAYYCAHAPFV